MSSIVNRSAARIPARSVTDQIERAAFARTEHNFLSGATALVKTEIALTQQSMYYKPGDKLDWSWDKRACARIQGRGKFSQLPTVSATYDADESVHFDHGPDDFDVPDMNVEFVPAVSGPVAVDASPYEQRDEPKGIVYLPPKGLTYGP